MADEGTHADCFSPHSLPLVNDLRTPVQHASQDRPQRDQGVYSAWRKYGRAGTDGTRRSSTSARPVERSEYVVLRALDGGTEANESTLCRRLLLLPPRSVPLDS